MNGSERVIAENPPCLRFGPRSSHRRRIVRLSGSVIVYPIFAIMVLAAAMTLSPGAAVAQERAGDAALGAISGALVGGPIGAVAGGVIGFTAGPNISRGWFGHRHHAAHRRSAGSSARRNEKSGDAR